MIGSPMMQTIIFNASARLQHDSQTFMLALPDVIMKHQVVLVAHHRVEICALVLPSCDNIPAMLALLLCEHGPSRIILGMLT